MKKNKATDDDMKEVELKVNFFKAKTDLRNFMYEKYEKYIGKPIQIRPNVFPKWKRKKIGFYDGFDLPTFMNHGRLHWGLFGKKRYYLCEDEFDIYKKPVKNRYGRIVHFADVKCSHCGHIGVYNVEYLRFRLNCEKCMSIITTINLIGKKKKK